MLIHASDYKKPKYLLNAHLETMLPALTRRVRGLPSSERIRIHTPDEDFLDLDFYPADSQRWLILSHGLEGDSRRPYMKGMIKKFHAARWNVVAWNYRGCGSEMNHAPRLYHSGATQDLDAVVRFALSLPVQHIALGGFSLGGNLTLKYLGEEKRSSSIRAAFAVSVPIDLQGCCAKLDQPHNWIYRQRFLKSLKRKALRKSEQFPGLIDISMLKKDTTLYAFDDHITAPLHGFASAHDYYAQCSAMHFIEGISIPTLVVNAASDPLLSASCLDPTKWRDAKSVYFELPKFGGHVGFSSITSDGSYWSEQRALEFLNQQMDEQND